MSYVITETCFVVCIVSLFLLAAKEKGAYMLVKVSSNFVGGNLSYITYLDGSKVNRKVNVHKMTYFVTKTSFVVHTAHLFLL